MNLVQTPPSPLEAAIPQPLRWSYAMLLVLLALAALDQTIVSTALPAIVAQLHGADRLSWVFSAYLIASTVAIPLYGKLADLHGARPVLIAAVTLFLLGSLLCGLSRDMSELILARGVQGAGGGGFLTLAMTAVVRAFPPAQRPRLQGLLGAVYGVATMLGPLAGGFLVEHASWRWAFFINLPIGMVALGVLALALPRQGAGRAAKMDWLGAALLTAALVSLLLSTRPHGGDAAVPALVLGLLGVMLTGLFVATQARAASPLLALTLFASREFSAASALSAASGVALFAVVVFMPSYFQIVRGLAPASAGAHLMPLMAGITLASVGTGRLLMATGRVRGTALVACALLTLSFVGLALIVRDPSLPLAWSSACLVPLGLGLGALFPLVSVVAQRSAPMPLMGMAMASPVMFRSVAGAVGVAALAALPGGMFWAAAGVSLLALVFARALPERLSRDA